MKALGAEIKQFWDEWPPGDSWYLDELDMDTPIEATDGTCLLMLDEKYDLDGFGVITWQGSGDPPKEAPVRGDHYVPFGTWFRVWKKSRTSKAFFVTVPNADVEEFRRLCAERRWKLI